MGIHRRVAQHVRWYELVPEGVLALGLGLFAVTEPRAAWAGIKSTKAVVLMVVVGAAWLTVRVLTFTQPRLRVPRFALFAAAALAILKVVVFPAYDDTTVVETLAPATTAPASATPAVSSEADAAISAPVRIGSGMLAGIDHRAVGTVNLYRQPTGAFVVGLEDFDIQPGPAYALYLVSGSDRRDTDGGVRISGLRGNRGTQFYDAPASVDLGAGAWTVLVWCETFDVPVAHATPV